MLKTSSFLGLVINIFLILVYVKKIPIHTSVHSEIIHNGKFYKYSIRNIGADEDSDGENVYRIVCRGAKFTQDFLFEDVDGAIGSLSDILSIMEREKRNDHTRLGFRITLEEKEIIEQNTKK